MFVLTRQENNIESGTYASIDKGGTPVVQFFVDKDDAQTYLTLLEAIGQDLHITETEDDSVDKLCSVLGYAYSVAEPGEIVIPRMETLYNDHVSENHI